MMLSYVQIWTKETVFPPELNEMKLSKCPFFRAIIIAVAAIITMKEGISCIGMLSTITIIIITSTIIIIIIIMKEGISCIDMLSTDTRRLSHRARFPGQDLQEVHLEHM